MERRLEVRAEYGSWGTEVYWSCVVEGTMLRVSAADAGATMELQLSSNVADEFFSDVQRFRLFDLPSTNYFVDCTDDLYHMGVSVCVQMGEKAFVHRVPTGVVVMVPTRRATKQQHICFSSFVHSVARRASELSHVNIPEHVALKWRSRFGQDSL